MLLFNHSSSSSSKVWSWFGVIALIHLVLSFGVNGLLIDSSSIQQNWENTHYLRTIDLARSYVRETDLIEIKNIDSKPHNEYYFSVNDGFDIVPKISIIAISLIDQAIEIEPILIENNLWKLVFPFPIASHSTIEFKVRYVYTNALSPLPSKLAIDENQNLLLKLNKLPYSFYQTNEYSLTFTGISKGQEMELNSPGFQTSNDVPDLRPKVENKSLKYGPTIETIKPFTIQPMGLLYEHNRPIPKVNALQRSIWLPSSDVGQISFEEYYELTNDAAALSTGFSRVDYMKGRYDNTRKHFSISHLELPLNSKTKFNDYYFTDLVGVVSTHQIAQNHLLLQPRFPIFGGWNYNFTLGWNNNLGDFVHKTFDSDDTYIVKVPLLNTVRDIFYDNTYLNFYLPENSELLNVSSPIEFESIKVENELSYLDVAKGHVKVTLHYKDLVDDLSKVDIYLLYKYSQKSYWSKVIAMSSWVFVGLFSIYLVGLINISIDKSNNGNVDEILESDEK